MKSSRSEPYKIASVKRKNPAYAMYIHGGYLMGF